MSRQIRISEEEGRRILENLKGRAGNSPSEKRSAMIRSLSEALRTPFDTPCPGRTA